MSRSYFSTGETLKPAIDLGPMPPASNKPTDILAAWTALEVLSPQSFQRPEQLANGDRRAIAPLDEGTLPWAPPGEKARPGRRLFYQVVLGSIDVSKATDKLLKVFADARVERPGARGQAILAAVVVDRDGRPVEADATAISSFGWGLPLALQGRLGDLADWPAAETRLKEGLAEIISKPDKDGKLQPLTEASISAAYSWLLEQLGLAPDLVRPPSFAVRSFPPLKSAEPAATLVLNSFYLRDLAKARELFKDGQAPKTLRLYLGQDRPAARLDLLNTPEALSRAVSPRRFPAARWPGRGRHPLVLLQQAAVNLAFDERDQGGILAVNGPPGTGKTTLLRDILAALVTERAKAMCAFDDPESAFEDSGEIIKAGAASLRLYRLDDSLKGFEMLVGSSNNKAVENVSAEIPGAKALADDIGDLKYFKPISDRLLDRETWGLGAAVLGKSANQQRLREIFWWDKDVGLETYLAHVNGTARSFTDEATGATRPPKIVEDMSPPSSHDQALRAWRLAQERFRSALAASEARLAELDRVRARCDLLPEVESALSAWSDAWACRPGFWSRLFRLDDYRRWKQQNDQACTALDGRLQAAQSEGAIPADMADRLRRATHSGKPAALKDLATELSRLSGDATKRREEIGARFIGKAFFERDHADRHQTAPWLSPEEQRLRDDVFVAALELHRAFIDGAARPLKHNLGALMNVMGGGTFGFAAKDALIPDLWSSLFLVSPAVSTTFASVDRMLGALPPESFGWLLIDEAGQGLPQAAVGALMRVRRAVVVGDPVQIPPVVTLPETLTAAINRRLGVDPNVYDAPGASVQTLADAATPYFAEFTGRNGSRFVGVPLLVHRRCDEPMFGVSNSVAYEQLMVQAKPAGPSPIRDLLGQSTWIDVTGDADDKWSKAEGDVVVELLARLTKARVAPDLYVVTPFRVVAQNLRRLILETGALGALVDDHEAWTREHVGTVHTVQGREAEAVIFVLGAPLEQQRGARAWAGGQPNLLNVAVTRAKEVLYVVGARDRWSQAGVFKELATRLPPTTL